MRLPGRLTAATEVLDEIENHKRPVSDALRDWGIRHRFAGAGDRAAIGNFVYDVLRRKGTHAQLMGTRTSRPLALSVAVREWGRDPEQLAADFAQDRFAPAPIEADELEHLRAPVSETEWRNLAQADVPEWAHARFQNAFGAAWLDEIAALCDRPPLDLRTNALKSAPERPLKSLSRFHPVQPGPGDGTLRFPAAAGDARSPNVTADEAYQKGWVEIQDLGSQIVSALIGAQPGHQVLDYCAGGGGKTLALASDMGNRGQIFAHDADRARLAPIYDRLKRAGARNVQVCAPGSDALDPLEGRMDKVVVDAPCTGSGTWRRRPDAKWRLTPAQLETRIAEQHGILRRAADFVAPDGELVYITCSLFPDENSAQIDRFLAENPSFCARDMRVRWTEIFPRQATPKWFGAQGGVLTPASTGTDGFFIAILTRSNT